MFDSGLLKCKPIPLSLRNKCLINKKVLWKGKCIKKLSYFIKKNNNHNSRGNLIFRRSRYVKKKYRILNYKNNFFGVPGKIIRLEYDPNRTSFISMVYYLNGVICYISTIEGVSEGDFIGSYISFVNSLDFFFKKGDTLSLGMISLGSIISNLELRIGLPPVYSKSAGTFCKLLREQNNNFIVELPTGKLIKLNGLLKATLGMNSNSANRGVFLSKAGSSFFKGKRPVVRGVAKNPVDHPHGGGEGKKSKKPDPMSNWGKVFKWRKKNV